MSDEVINKNKKVTLTVPANTDNMIVFISAPDPGSPDGVMTSLQPTFDYNMHDPKDRQRLRTLLIQMINCANFGISQLTAYDKGDPPPIQWRNINEGS